MSWLLRGLVIVVLGCGGKKEEPKPEPPPPPPKEESGGLFGDLKSKAKEVGGEMADKVGDKAKDLGGDVRDKANAVGGDVIDKAKAVAEKAGELSSDALAQGKSLKSDLQGKVDLLGMNYDLAVDSTPESEANYLARISGMKQVKVGDYTVGIAQDSKHPLGTVYKWQFRITWRVPLSGKAIRLSVFTNEELKDLAVAENLLTIISATDRLLPK